MPSRVTFARIQAYLDAIADNPANRRSVDDSGHGRFWQVTFQQFTTGVVPNEDCANVPIPIVDKDPDKCPFFQSLKNVSGWCNTQQMPKKGPYVVDAGYSVTLKDGTIVTGQAIQDDIVWWLTNDMPEH